MSETSEDYSYKNEDSDKKKIRFSTKHSEATEGHDKDTSAVAFEIGDVVKNMIQNIHKENGDTTTPMYEEYGFRQLNEDEISRNNEINNELNPKEYCIVHKFTPEDKLDLEFVRKNKNKIQSAETQKRKNGGTKQANWKSASLKNKQEEDALSEFKRRIDVYSKPLSLKGYPVSSGTPRCSSAKAPVLSRRRCPPRRFGYLSRERCGRLHREVSV